MLSVWSISAHIQYIFKNYHHFSSNWLRSKCSLIYSDRRVKPDNFGDISVFCWDASYLSWEAFLQNFVFIFLLQLTSPNFRNNKKIHVSSSFTFSHGPTVKHNNILKSPSFLDIRLNRNFWERFSLRLLISKALLPYSSADSYYVCVFFRICKWRLAVLCSKRSLTKDYLRACIFSSDGSILKSGKRAKKMSLENNYSVMSLAIAAAFSRTEKIIYIPFSFSSSQIKKEILSGMKTFF